jgi:hypothetical protein
MIYYSWPIFGHSLKNKHFYNMLPIRTQWAMFAFVFALNSPLFAQRSCTPLQEEWLPRIMHLWTLSKKTAPKRSNQAATCLVSNEITIVILPCSDSQKKKNAVFSKPIQ